MNRAENRASAFGKNFQFVQVKNDRLFFGCDGRRIGLVVEDGQLSDGRARALDMGACSRLPSSSRGF
jgi:hypothetical protein